MSRSTPPAGTPTAAEDQDWLGARLLRERENRGWSLAALAERSGVSKAQISKIERGASSPTAAVLGRLSGAFGLTLSTLLARAEAPPTGRVVRSDDHPRWQDPETGYVRRLVTHGSTSRVPFELIQVELPPAARVHYPASAFVFLRQVVLVLTGRLTFTDGETRHLLEPGDSIELGDPAERVFENASRRPCTYLVALSHT